jgi:hypothetical protein
MNELLCMKNAGVQIAYEGLAPMAIEKNQNPGGRFGATSLTVLPIQHIWPNFSIVIGANY